MSAAPIELHVVTPHPPDTGWLDSARRQDARMHLAEVAVDVASMGERPPMVALPAGFFSVPSLTRRDDLAERLRQLSEQVGAGLFFGVDVVEGDWWDPRAGAPASYIYVCQAGRRLLWEAPQDLSKGRPTSLEERCLQIEGSRIGVLVGSEIFDHRRRRAVAARGPDVVLVLVQGALTQRWEAPLQAMDALVPTLVVGQGKEAPVWTPAPQAWASQVVSRSAAMTIHQFSRTRAAA